MTPPLAINGRFLTQPLTGVQRFAAEMALALAALRADGEAPPLRLLCPPGAAPLPGLPAETVGNAGGQRWEQWDLPRAARPATLLSLGNTGPVLAGRRQAVVIHDAGVFDTPDSYSRAFRAWYMALQWALVRAGARLLTVSEFSRGRIAHHLRLDPARIGVVSEGGEHILREPAATDILARHRLQPGRFVLVVGTRAAHKGLDALREAAGLLATRGLTLAVAGAADATVYRNAADPGGSAVVALGRVSDAELRALYEAALCLVFPSRYEGFGLPPLEAMTCGCPVVAAEAASVPEVCGDAALWFDLEGPRRLTDTLARLLDEPGLGERLRRAGRARAARFSWCAAAAGLLRQLPEAADAAR